MNPIKTEVINILRAAPRIILLASLFTYLVTDDLIALRFAFYFFSAEVVSHILKGTTKLAFGKHPAVYRPRGAGHCQGCGTFPKCPNPTDPLAKCLDVSGNIGMPSGHSLSSSFAATFWIMYIWDAERQSQSSKIIRSILLALAAKAVMFSRSYLVENCHTIPQIFIGSSVGVGLGALAYKMDQKYVKDMFKNVKI